MCIAHFMPFVLAEEYDIHASLELAPNALHRTMVSTIR
jgi:hypothetical protein